MPSTAIAPAAPDISSLSDSSFVALTHRAREAWVDARLEKHGARELVSALAHSLADKSSPYRAESARRLGELGAIAEPALLELMRAVVSTDHRLSTASSQSLSAIVGSLAGDVSSRLAVAARYLPDEEMRILLERAADHPAFGFALSLSVLGNKGYFREASISLAERLTTLIEIDGEAAIRSLVTATATDSLLSDVPERAARILSCRTAEAWPRLLEKLTDGSDMEARGAIRSLTELAGLRPAELGPDRLEFLAGEIVRRVSKFDTSTATRTAGLLAVARISQLEPAVLESSASTLIDGALAGPLYARAEVLRSLAPIARAMACLESAGHAPLLKRLRHLENGCFSEEVRPLLAAALEG